MMPYNIQVRLYWINPKFRNFPPPKFHANNKFGDPEILISWRWVFPVKRNDYAILNFNYFRHASRSFVIAKCGLIQPDQFSRDWLGYGHQH